MNLRLICWKLKKYIKFNNQKIKFKWEYVVQNLYVSMKSIKKYKIIVYQNIDEDTRVVNVIESFEKSSPKKMPIRQVRTEEKKKLVIKQFSKIPGEFYDITQMIGSHKFLLKGRSTGMLVEALFHNSPQQKASLVKTKTYIDNKVKTENISSEIEEDLKTKTPRTVKTDKLKHYNDNNNSNLNLSSSVNKTEELTTDKTKKVKVTERDITPYEEMQIKGVFHKLFLFEIFPDDVLDIILTSLLLIKISKNDYLFRKGKRDNNFYIVLSGEIDEVDLNGEVVKKYRAWDSFGHKSLMVRDHVGKAEFDAQCAEDAELFILNGESFLTIKQRLINLRLQERYEFLNTIIFFKTLDSIVKHSIADKMRMVSFKKNDKIITKGEEEKCVYLIKSGSVRCVYNDSEYKVLGVSNYVGIISIIMKTSRTMDVFAEEDTTCFALSDEDLRDAIGTNYMEVMLQSIFKEYIYSNSTFSDIINDKNMIEVFSKFSLKFYTKNEKINEKNKNLKRIVLVLEGNFTNPLNNKITYASGSIIGEETITNNMDINPNLEAYPDCLTLEANLFDVSDFLGEEFRASTINLLHKVIKMKKVKFFTLLADNTLKLIVDNIKKEKFCAGQKIIEECTEGDKFYIIIKGTVRVSQRDKQIRELEHDSFFGEIALLKPKLKRTATITAANNVNCYVIRKKDFLLIANDPNISKILLKQMALQNDEITLEELRAIKKLGNGKFGTVTLVHDDNNVYAIKAINRREANLKKRVASYLIWERRIMLCVDHPFIGKMVKSFKNDNYVFLLLEFINGVSLKELLISNQNVFNMNHTRFYISSLLLIVDYLHHKGIVHRDIKTNNIMVDEAGFIKLIDFGTAKVVRDYTNTIIGTPHYMAPEVLAGKGYSFSCDYWAIGVIAFEIFYHKYPFGNEANEIMEIYNEIMYSAFRFPFENDMFADLNNFISTMLNKQVSKRCCSLSKLKKMELFETVNWDDLIDMRVTPPFKPDSINLNEINFGNFQISYEEEINDEAGFRMMSIRKGEQIDLEWAKEF